MAVCVVCKEMSVVHERSRDLWARRDELTDEEERRFDLVPRENFDEALGVQVVRSIVKRERKMPWIGTARQGPSVELRSRRITVVRKPRRAGDCAGSSYFREHDCDSNARKRLFRKSVST